MYTNLAIEMEMGDGKLETAMSPKVVVKLDYRINDTEKYTPIPELRIFANEQGFRNLSQFFAEMADDAAELPKEPYPHEDRIPWYSKEVFFGQFNSTSVELEYSDTITLRAIPINDATQSQLFKLFRVTRENARKDSLINRYADQIKETHERIVWITRKFGPIDDET